MSSINNNGTISISVGAIGATGASGSVTGAIGANGGYSSIITSIGGGGGTGSVYGGGSLTSASITGSYTTVSKPVFYTESTEFENDIVIKQRGESIHVGKTIKAILDTFYIIIPDQKLLDSNPSLKAAYEHHQSVIQETLGERLKDAYNSYKTIEKLVLDKDDQTDI